MRAGAVVPGVLLAGGVAAIGVSLFAGGAHAALIVIFPVIYGSSLLFVAGILLVIAGLFSLPWAFPAEGAGEDAPVAAAEPPPSSSGGFVLVGPVPILFGSMRGASRRTRLLLVAIGGVLLATAVVGLLLLAR